MANLIAIDPTVTSNHVGTGHRDRLRPVGEEATRLPAKRHSSEVPPKVSTTSRSTVKVWFASITEAFRLAEPAMVLDAGEMAQAEQFDNFQDRDRFLAGRILLRHALSWSVDGEIAPSKWRYRRGPNGELTMASGLPETAFNLSQSGQGLAVAISTAGAIGIDVEMISDGERTEFIDDFLTDRELASLKYCSKDKVWSEFVRIWAAKEACAKALGQFGQDGRGTSLDFRQIEIDLDGPDVRHDAGVLRSSDIFSVAMRTVVRSGIRYCMSVANISNSNQTASVCFRPLGEGYAA